MIRYEIIIKTKKCILFVYLTNKSDDDFKYTFKIINFNFCFQK